MVRYRELEALLPELDLRGIHVQIVTSAFRPIPAHWASFKRLNIVVSVDGLQPEHDVRRKPAIYERILKNLAEATVTIHCTITGQIADRPGYIELIGGLTAGHLFKVSELVGRSVKKLASNPKKRTAAR